MPYETDFDAAFTLLLSKAQGTDSPTSPAAGGTTTTTNTVFVPSSYSVCFMFTGGGQALTTTIAEPILVEVPDVGEIVWAHMYAGDHQGRPVSTSATVGLYVTTEAGFGGNSLVSGTGNAPNLVSNAHSSVSMSGWYQHLDAGQALIAILTSVSGGPTWVALVLKVRRDQTAQNFSNIVDGGIGNNYVDAFGVPYVIRTG